MRTVYVCSINPLKRMIMSKKSDYPKNMIGMKVIRAGAVRCDKCKLWYEYCKKLELSDGSFICLGWG